MKRSFLILTLCIAVLSVTVLLPGIKRCRAIAKFLDLPGARQRASIVPSFMHFDAPPSTNPVNIGYATFDLGSATPVVRTARGSNATSILINAGDFRFLILPPFSPKNLGLQADSIAAFQDIEQVQPLSLSQVFWMNCDAFLAYSFRLSEKASYRLGHNEVCCFTSPHAKGIIYIGADPTDRRQAILDISSPDGKLNVGFNAHLEGPSTGDIGPILKHIAASFQFTIDAIPAPQEIAKRIADQGIPKRPEDSPPAHLPPHTK
jgi:hypothetical protein